MDAPPHTTPAAAAPRAGSTTFFFAVTLAITWTLQLPAALAKLGVIDGGVEMYMPLVALGAFGPLIGAIVAARREAGRAGVRTLFASLGNWRVGVGWYAIALFGLGAAYVAGTAVYRLAFGAAHAGQWLYPPENAAHIIAMVIFPLVEEPGWRGFAQPRLQARHGALRAALIVGFFWAIWHTMMFIAQGMTPFGFVVACVNIFAGSVVFAWFYNRTRGSLLLAVLLHAGAHLNNPTHAVPANLTPFNVYTAALCVAALALALFDRRATCDARAPLGAPRQPHSPSAA